MNKIKKQFEKNIYFILAIATILFFLFGQGVMWYVIGGDTLAYYLTFEHKVETTPLYPLFFHILDLIFGQEVYLYVAAVIQMIVATICITLFVAYIGKCFELNLINILIVWIGALLPFYLLLPEDPIPHILMTESFTYPLLYVYMILILEGMFAKKERCFFVSCILIEIMALIRGQMLFLYAVSIIVYFYYLIKKGFSEKKGIKKSLMKGVIGKSALLVLCALLCMGTGKVFTQIYEKVFFDAPAQSFSDHLAVQKALYCSDEEDVNLFTDEIEKEIFANAYAKAKETESTYEYMPGDLYDWYHIECGCGSNSYYVSDAIKESLLRRGMLSDNEFEQTEQVLEYCRRLTSKLLHDNWKQYVLVFFKMLPTGFISTVLFQKESIYLLIHWATLFIYILSIVCSFLISRLKRELLKESEFMWLILGTAIVNVISANVVHFGIQRYCAYTIGMFYVAAWLMVRRLGNILKEKKAR